MRILGISGSLRRDSHNGSLLRAVADLLPPGVDLVEFEDLATIPPYDQDEDTVSPPAPVTRLRGEIAGADAVVFSTPEYNTSIPGVLKNAVDWASRPFPENALRGKPVLVIGASTGLFGAVWAQAELRKVLDHTGADVLDTELGVGTASEAFGDDGGLRDAELAERLSDQVSMLVREAEPTLGIDNPGRPARLTAV